MPFTFSHPAIVLPLARLAGKWLSLTGLVVGSLTPDFEYFLRLKMQSQYSHTLSGLFWFDLPLGLLLAYLFHNAVRNSLIDNLPRFLKSRLQRFKRIDWNRHVRTHWLAVAVSILIGAASHLLWDAFTHSHGIFVERLPALASKVSLFDWRIPIFKLLQHGSTLLGGLIIGLTIYQLPPEKCQPYESPPDVWYWLIVFGIMLAIITARILGGLSHNAYGDMIATGISAGLVAVTATPLIMRWIITMAKRT